MDQHKQYTEHETDIAVRAYLVHQSVDNVQGKVSLASLASKGDANSIGQIANTFDRMLVFDTETTIDRHQNLKVGHFKVYQYSQLAGRGMFYNPSFLSNKELTVLRQYCKEHSLQLSTVRDFVDKIFLPEVYDYGTLCVGFNLPFDLSRLHIEYGYARGSKMKGGFSFKLTKLKHYPRLKIKHVNSTMSFIRFGERIDKTRFDGNFVDLRTFVHAMTGEKHSLRSACILYDTPHKKADFEWKGIVTKQSLDYLVDDVNATFSLYCKLKEHYDLFGLDLPVTNVYSAASLGKAVLKMMGIKEGFAKISTITNVTKGYIVATYYGGRTEDKIRKKSVTVTVLDFLSMYPTMCILAGLWDYIICDHIEEQLCTEEARLLLKTITEDDLRKQETWSKLNIIVELEDNQEAILPIRAHFGDNIVWNIAINYVNTQGKLWYALADVLNSKLQTGGQIPKISRAIKFVPVGKQVGMQKVTILGKELDPYKDNLFKWLIEYRNELKNQRDSCPEGSPEWLLLDKKQNGLKILANATSYGIFMQVDVSDEETDVTVYGLSQFKARVKKKEEFAKYTNPIISTFITAGARLILGLAEQILAKHGATHAYCDTDSMVVPSQYKEELQRFFKPLNPYEGDVEMFKVEDYKDENDKKHKLENVVFYGISSKRYVTYRIEPDGSKTILKASSHGLKHLLNPFGSHEDEHPESDDNDQMDVHWHKQVWLDILLYNEGKIGIGELNEKYDSIYAMAKLSISTPSIMDRFRILNKGKTVDKQIKPFNFCIVGIGNQVDEATGKTIKPLSPFKKNAHLCPYQEFVDYHSGKILQGPQYWQKFSKIFWDYDNHREAKFNGDLGPLERKHIKIRSAVHVGKESNNLDLSEIIGVQEDDYVIYKDDYELISKHKELILTATPKEIKTFGIMRNELWSIKRTLTSGNYRKLKAKTASKLLAYLQANL